MLLSWESDSSKSAVGLTQAHFQRVSEFWSLWESSLPLRLTICSTQFQSNVCMRRAVPYIPIHNRGVMLNRADARCFICVAHRGSLSVLIQKLTHVARSKTRRYSRDVAYFLSSSSDKKVKSPTVMNYNCTIQWSDFAHIINITISGHVKCVQFDPVIL
jgi:hypothetical protein